jgi:catechol 2,3-dioxygenase-like lactoylglutathione lyase family enzyme
MNRLPLLRISEVAFLTPKLEECVEFYRKIGLQDLPLNPQRINFANIGEQLFGFADEKKGFLDGYGGYTKALFHVAFEVPSDKLDECVAFLNEKGITTSPKNDFSDWHGTTKSTSVYFTDPAGNIMELWAPQKKP